MKFLLAFLFFLPLSLQAMAIKTMNVEVEGATLFCRTIGKGAPLVIVHGGPGLNQNYLLPHFYRLTKDNFLIFYDQRGCGQTTGTITSEVINMKTFVEDLEGIRLAFGYEKISILGHSWGGLVALAYATAHPESVDKLILSNATPADSEGFALFMEEWTKRMSPHYAVMAEIMKKDAFLKGDPIEVEKVHKMMLATYCYDPKKVDLLQLRMDRRAAINGAAVYELIRENFFMHPYSYLDALKRIHFPTLIIHGDVDPIPFAVAQKTHEGIEDSTFIVMEKCGHFPFVEDPQIYFDHLKEFLSN